IRAGKDFDESSEIRQPNYFAQIDLAHFGLGGYVLDDLDGFVSRGFVGRGHIHLAVVGDVNLDASLLDDGTDHLATGPDDITDLVSTDLEGINSRSITGGVATGSRDRFKHLVEDKEPSAKCLIEGFGHDSHGQPANLDVHLQGSDSIASAGYLEIHVTIMILGTSNICQNGVLVAFFHQAHSDSC